MMIASKKRAQKDALVALAVLAEMAEVPFMANVIREVARMPDDAEARRHVEYVFDLWARVEALQPVPVWVPVEVRVQRGRWILERVREVLGGRLVGTLGDFSSVVDEAPHAPSLADDDAHVHALVAAGRGDDKDLVEATVRDLLRDAERAR